jgi:hypothetical protein
VGIGTTNPGTNKLEVNGTAKFDGLVTFTSGQTLPGTATLGANTFTGNQTVNGNVSAVAGSVTAMTIVSDTGFNIGSKLFAWGSDANQNAFLGFGGNTTTYGYQNTASGYNALASNTTGEDNTANGAFALYMNTQGNYNTASGYNALYSNTTGRWNTATGNTALIYNTTGDMNTASGMDALEQNTTGSDNTASGVYALNSNTGGGFNTAVGQRALYSNATGSYNTALGDQADVGSGSLTNATAIGARAYVTQSNSMILGSINGVNNATSNTNVGIGTTTPDNLLSVNGSADKPGGGSWGTYSDRRLKTVQGSFDSGLRQILRLHPVRYHYNDLNAMGIHDSQEHVGLVAQDVQKVIPEAVTENSKGYLLLNNDPILWSMLNAIKEQQALIDKQQEQIRAQQAQIAKLNTQVKAIKASLNTNARSGSELRVVKAQVSVVHQ